MKSEIIKTKFLCKTTMREGSIHNTKKWDDVFIEGKLYEGEYETWSWEGGYKSNSGWRSYWVIDESGNKIKLHRFRFRAVFHDVDETRNMRIEEILNPL
jgi:hypothetical protein